MPKYSVVIPTTRGRHDSGGLYRAVDSVKHNTFKDVEVIVVNTTSKNIPYVKDDRVTTINLGWDSERVIGRNEGMVAARGEWVCWLDSDDEYLSNYFDKLNLAQEEYPDAVCFNFGTLVHWKGLASTVREAFRPAKDRRGHVEFKSGQISTGSFVFKRSILGDVDLLPYATVPYGAPDSFSGVANNPNYPVREDGQYPPMGNPWGDDYQMFYQITRMYHSIPLDVVLYEQHVR